MGPGIKALQMVSKAGPSLAKVSGNVGRLMKMADKKQYVGKFSGDVIGWAKRLRGKI